jgi:hypothetical protein
MATNELLMVRLQIQLCDKCMVQQLKERRHTGVALLGSGDVSGFLDYGGLITAG